MFWRVRNDDWFACVILFQERGSDVFCRIIDRLRLYPWHAHAWAPAKDTASSCLVHGAQRCNGLKRPFMIAVCFPHLVRSLCVRRRHFTWWLSWAAPDDRLCSILLALSASAHVVRPIIVALFLALRPDLHTRARGHKRPPQHAPYNLLRHMATLIYSNNLVRPSTEFSRINHGSNATDNCTQQTVRNCCLNIFQQIWNFRGNSIFRTFACCNIIERSQIWTWAYLWDRITGVNSYHVRDHS